MNVIDSESEAALTNYTELNCLLLLDELICTNAWEKAVKCAWVTWQPDAIGQDHTHGINPFFMSTVQNTVNVTWVGMASYSVGYNTFDTEITPLLFSNCFEKKPM